VRRGSSRLKGKPWTVDEEKQLRELLQQGLNAYEIGVEMGKAPNAIYEKAKRLGSRVIFSCNKKIITSRRQLPPTELPSVEEKLKALAAALETPGLDRSEVLRLRSIIQGVKIYQELFAGFVDYRRIEAELLEVRRQLAEERSNKT
jgi:hypothetical protein